MSWSYKQFLTCTFFILIFSGYQNREHEQKLQDREKALALKEQELKVWEQRLKLREEELDKREKQDSLNADTIGFFNPSIPGDWLVKMRCTETSCETSAIGDTRTEKWHMEFENNKVIVKALSNNKVTRVYSGLYNGQSLQLKANDPSSDTDIKVSLSFTAPSRMEGERQISQSGNCKVTYALTLEKL